MARDRRKGDWFVTFTGRRFWPFDPRPEDVCLDDVAHALARLCRFGGHVVGFYSVAQHSVLVASLVPPEHELVALLHDATEAYLGDVIRPLKRGLAAYQAAEVAVWRAVAERFGLPVDLPAAVKQADDVALLTERRDLTTRHPDACPWREDDETELALLPYRRIIAEPPPAAEERFRARFAELGGRER